jgi:hypothetical protein
LARQGERQNVPEPLGDRLCQQKNRKPKRKKRRQKNRERRRRKRK